MEIERRYDERRYAEHGGTQSIGDLEQLKDELKKEMAQHEQTKQDLEKAQTKIEEQKTIIQQQKDSVMDATNMKVKAQSEAERWKSKFDPLNKELGRGEQPSAQSSELEQPSERAQPSE